VPLFRISRPILISPLDVRLFRHENYSFCPFSPLLSFQSFSGGLLREPDGFFFPSEVSAMIWSIDYPPLFPDVCDDTAPTPFPPDRFLPVGSAQPGSAVLAEICNFPRSPFTGFLFFSFSLAQTNPAFLLSPLYPLPLAELVRCQSVSAAVGSMISSVGVLQPFF